LTKLTAKSLLIKISKNL